MLQHRSVIVLTDGRQVCLSYGTPVAAFLPGVGYVKRDEFFSVTTSRHANQYAGKDALLMPTATFLEAVGPVQDAI